MLWMYAMVIPPMVVVCVYIPVEDLVADRNSLAPVRHHVQYLLVGVRVIKWVQLGIYMFGR